MAKTTVEPLPSGQWRVSRDFDSLSAATAAIKRLAEVNEAAFTPPKPIIASVPRAWLGGSGQTYPTKLAAVTNGEQIVNSVESEQHHAIEAPMPPFATLDADDDMGLKAGEAVK